MQPYAPCPWSCIYADHPHEPAKALEVAQQEYAWRHDVYTLDAYAWALHVNGKDQDARKQLERALAVGIRDGKFFRHAAAIAIALGDTESEQRYGKEAALLGVPELVIRAAKLDTPTVPGGIK